MEEIQEASDLLILYIFTVMLIGCFSFHDIVSEQSSVSMSLPLMQLKALQLVLHLCFNYLQIIKIKSVCCSEKESLCLILLQRQETISETTAMKEDSTTRCLYTQSNEMTYHLLQLMLLNTTRVAAKSIANKQSL